VRINRNSLVLTNTDHEAHVAGVVASERSANYDHTRLSLLAPMAAQVDLACHAIPSPESETFIEFLRKVNRGHAGRAARAFGQAVARDLQIEIGGFFELNAKVVTNAGEFTIDELIRAWAFLVAVATLGQRWNERHIDTMPLGRQVAELSTSGN
jgi:hypothetical protein